MSASLFGQPELCEHDSSKAKVKGAKTNYTVLEYTMQQPDNLASVTQSSSSGKGIERLLEQDMVTLGTELASELIMHSGWYSIAWCMLPPQALPLGQLGRRNCAEFLWRWRVRTHCVERYVWASGSMMGNRVVPFQYLGQGKLL